MKQCTKRNFVSCRDINLLFMVKVNYANVNTHELYSIKSSRIVE